MAQLWLHYGCSKGVPQNLQAEASGCSGRINLAKTLLQLGNVLIALHVLEGIQKSIEVSPSHLTVLLPFHGEGIGSQYWKSRI